MPRRSKYNLAFKPACYWKDSLESPTAPTSDNVGDPGLEIARLEFKYGELKEVRIYAYLDGGYIRYQVGKGDSRLYGILPKPSSSPLNFEGLIDLIEECIHPGDLRKFNSTEKTAQDLSEFVRASSFYYPELSVWYRDEGREWLKSNNLYYTTNNLVYLAVSIAALVSLSRINDLDFGFIEVIIVVYFGLSVISLTWSDDLKTGAFFVWRWLLVGIAALIVSRGLSLTQCAFLIASGSLLYLVVGLIVNIRFESYRPLSRYRFSGISNPNMQAAYCAMLLLSGTYLFQTGIVSVVPWTFLMSLVVVLLLLTRSRTGFWATVAAVTTFSGLEFWFTVEQAGWRILLMIVVTTKIFMALLRNTRYKDEKIPANPSKEYSLQERVSSLANLERDHLVRNNLGGRLGLWRYLLVAIKEKPLLGYGHGFWTPDRERQTLRILNWSAISGHSIYFDSLLNTGVIGLGLVTSIIMICLLSVFYLDAPEVLFIASAGVFITIYGVFESSFCTPNFFSFSLFLMICAIPFPF